MAGTKALLIDCQLFSYMYMAVNMIIVYEKEKQLVGIIKNTELSC